MSFFLAVLLSAPARAQFELHSGPYFKTEESTAPAPAEEPPESLEDEFGKQSQLDYSQAQWNEARDHVEKGETEVVVYSTAGIYISTAPPTPRPPEVVLPEYGTSLAVTGRKIIGFNYTNKTYLQAQTNVTRPQSTSLFDIQQQLQIRMVGKVGPKISVNVDYDDTKPNKQDISVVYQGDPNEVVQQASFGDISLSLPSTEFISYNKQLFGIRADLKYNNFTAILIASRTKGTTKTKEFIGNTQFQALDIPDTGYVRRQYYDLSFGNPANLPITPGSETVYLDVESGAQVVNTSSMTADDYATGTKWSAFYAPLGRGTDYTINYQTGVLTLRVAAQPQYVLAVNYTSANGRTIASANGSGLPKLIKTNGDQPIAVNNTTPAGQIDWNREIKTVYSIGRQQIIPDNGHGNFILQVLDASRNNVGGTLSPPQVYPQTINVDFAQGLIELTTTFPEAEIYAPTPIGIRTIHVEFSSRLKTFLLEPSIVPQSDNVVVDGALLVRNQDYFIDYDVGFVTFFNPDRIGPQSKIDITYDVAPFGGIGTDSLLGGRVAYSPTKHWAIASTVLYDAGSEAPTVPEIGDTPRALLVMDADSELKDLQPFKWLKANFGLEGAQSRDNPNLNGYALVDNFEGIKQETDATPDQNVWFIAANPNGQAYSGPADPLAITWKSYNVNATSVNPGAAVAPGAQQEVLEFDYNFAVNNSNEVSLVYVFNTAGVDFSQKTFLQLVMAYDATTNPTGQGPEMNVHLGSIQEDADNTGGMTLFCANGQVIYNAPKTEDTDCTGILSPAKDIGWLYAPAGKNSIRYGANNGRLDTEDLNRNGRLDSEDLSGCSAGYAAISTTSATGAVGCPSGIFNGPTGSTFSLTTAGGFVGSTYQTINIPLNISSNTATNWTAIREVRISLRREDLVNVGATGAVKFAKIAVVGNAWQEGQMAVDTTTLVAPSTGSLAVSAVNNIDTPGYIPIFSAGGIAETVYNNLYGSVSQQEQLTQTQNVTEGSLGLQFQALPTGTTAFTLRRFAKALDFSTQGGLHFLLYGCAPIPAPGTTSTDCGPSATAGRIFFMRVGTDTDYWELQVPINFVGWKQFDFNMIDPTKRGVSNVITAADPGETVVAVGNPNLQGVGVVYAGLYNYGPSMGLTETINLWLDELYLDKPNTRVGNAMMARADFEIPKWMTFGGKYRWQDRNFETPVSVVTGQDNEQDSVYAKLTRLSFFPLSFTGQRQYTDTPSVAQTGNTSNLVNSLAQGQVTRWTGDLTGTLAYKAYPKLTLTHDWEKDQYDALDRHDDRETYSGIFSYTVPGTRRWLPHTLDLNYMYSTYAVDYGALAAYVPGNYNSYETTNGMGGKMSFQPWNGTTITPNYSLKLVHENRVDYTQTPTYEATYPKEMDQTAGFQSTFQLAKWLKPSANYTVTTVENNNLSTTSFVVGTSTLNYNVGQLKTVNQTATGGVNLPLSVGEIFPSIKMLHSMNIVSGYQLQDGDVWQNVESGLDTMSNLWLRSGLHPNSPVAQEANLTQRDTYTSTIRWSPLDSFNLPGRWGAFKTLGLTDNFNYSTQHSEVTGTPTNTTSETLPDLVVTLGKVEQLLHTEAYMANTQLNLKYSHQTTMTEGVSDQYTDKTGLDLHFMFLKKYDTAITADYNTSVTDNLQTGVQTNDTVHKDATVQTTFNEGKWRFTPKIDYTDDVTTAGGVPSSDVTVITPAILARADLLTPRGLILPFMTRPLIFTNRVIWTTNLSFAIRRSPVTEEDNNDLLNLTTNADYELAQNLRMAINASVQRLWHLYLPQEEFFSYTVGSTLTFQF